MSFEDMKVGELREIATDWFAVDLEGVTNKAGVIQTMLDEGVTYPIYLKEKERREGPVEETEVVETPTPEIVVTKPVTVTNAYLVKMERPNTYYESFGKVFTKESPFAVCDDRTARNILERESGFRLATPSEAESFYG